MKTLPNNLIDLLKITVKDLRKVKADPKYVINMSTWHMPLYLSEKCQVCMAGAIMAKTLNADSSEHLAPFEFGHYNNIKLNLIDSIRSGFFGLNLIKLNWRKSYIDLDRYNLQNGDLDELERLIKDLEDEPGND